MARVWRIFVFELLCALWLCLFPYGGKRAGAGRPSSSTVYFKENVHGLACLARHFGRLAESRFVSMFFSEHVFSSSLKPRVALLSITLLRNNSSRRSPSSHALRPIFD
jgi:hypothetical protein